MHHYKSGALIVFAKIFLVHMSHGEPVHPNLKKTIGASSQKRELVASAPIGKRSNYFCAPISMVGTSAPLKMWSIDVFGPKEHWCTWLVEQW